MLGEFEISFSGVVEPLSARPQQKAPQKPLELLRLLACENGLSKRMELAADELWPDADGAAAYKNMEVTVQRLRRLLRDDSLLRVHESVVALDSTRVSSDVLHRRRLVERLQALSMLPRPEPSSPLVTERLAECSALATRLAYGPSTALLPDAPNSRWLEAARAQYQRERRMAIGSAEAVYTRSAPLDSVKNASDLRAVLLVAISGM